MGIKRRSGKGERCIVIGIGGPDGWVEDGWEVYKRSKNTGNSMEYKDDMGRYLGSFENFPSIFYHAYFLFIFRLN